MIRFNQGNILHAEADVLVNTVNLQGVMGKGVALAFKKAFPNNFNEYVKACQEKRIAIGKIFVSQTDLISPRYIVNFPTKKHWRYPSKIEYIEAGLQDLVQWIEKHPIRSIALPPLGSGQGKLEWQLVKSLLQKYFNNLSSSIEILIYEPSSAFEEMHEVLNISIEKLTPARAMLLYMMRQYKLVGNEINLLVIQKLAYFLQRFGEPLRLKYEKGWYGPYAPNLIPVLKAMNGTYIQYRSESIKPETIIKLISSNSDSVEHFYHTNLSSDQKNRIKEAMKLIEGFESPFGLELLGSVDFVMQHDGCTNIDEILSDLQSWTKRKKELIKRFHIEVAFERLKSSSISSMVS